MPCAALLLYKERLARERGWQTVLKTLRLQDGGWWHKAWNSSHGSADTFEYLQSLIELSDL